MAYICHEVNEWIEETIEEPVEQWVEQQVESCVEEECNWLILCANRVICTVTTTLVKVITFITVTVLKLITTTVCEWIMVVAVFVSDQLQPIFCLWGLSFDNADLFDLEEAILFAKISLETYEDEEDADFEQFSTSPGAHDMKQIDFIENTQPLAYTYPLDTQVFILLDGAKDRLIVAFRGSKGVVDWINDLTALPVPYLSVTEGLLHAGFWAAYNSVRVELTGRLLEIILNQLNTKNPVTQIVFTGHSLGGALAALAAHDFHVQASNQVEIRTYTYGAPRFGNLYVTADYNARLPHTFRMVNEEDPVPELPATGGPTDYRHTQNFVFLDSAGSLAIEPCPRPVYDWAAQVGKLLPAGVDIAVTYIDALLAVGLATLDAFEGHSMTLYIDRLEAQVD